MTRQYLLGVLFALALAGTASAQAPETEDTASEPPMTFETMVELFTALDPEARVGGNGVALTIGNVPVTIVTDVRANRMRILVPIASAAALDDKALMRLMQANFDTALDARYAVANGRLWSVYIHPLAQLERAQLVSGLAQTVTLARNYGTSYASGGVVFGGGDSGALFQELLDRSEEL